MVVTLSMLLAPLLFALHERLLARWLERAQRARVRHHRRARQPGDHRRLTGASARSSRACCACAASRLPRSKRTTSRSISCAASATRSITATPRASTCCSAAKAGEAKLFVLAIDDVEASVKTAALVRRHFPDLPILARARNRVHHFRLRDLGIKSIYRETFPSSLEVAHQALLRLGLGVAAARARGRAVQAARRSAARGRSTRSSTTRRS